MTVPIMRAGEKRDEERGQRGRAGRRERTKAEPGELTPLPSDSLSDRSSSESTEESPNLKEGDDVTRDISLLFGEVSGVQPREVRGEISEISLEGSSVDD